MKFSPSRCGCWCRCRRRSRSSSRTSISSPINWASLNAAGINYQTVKMAEALKRLGKVEEFASGCAQLIALPAIQRAPGNGNPFDPDRLRSSAADRPVGHGQHDLQRSARSSDTLSGGFAWRSRSTSPEQPSPAAWAAPSASRTRPGRRRSAPGRAHRTCCSSSSTTPASGQLGCYGSPIHTPNLDKLAKHGLLYHQHAHHGALLAVAVVHAHGPQPPFQRTWQCITEGSDRLPRFQRHDPVRERISLGDAPAARLQHLLRPEGASHQWRRSSTRIIVDTSGS